MIKPIVRYEKAWLMGGRGEYVQAKIGNADMSEFFHVGPVMNASFNRDGTCWRVETKATVYVQVGHDFLTNAV
ncbi:hypothetical protein [Stenotrophomonas phage YB07]|uniref:Uncharacterized protein n=1 Tax=Stenotrophomonas phage YB07 TaxID=2555548 RepID=A0A482II26_9CAUD|nr:hypothetical protein HWC11_gp215 [Stenotrophomonas phage YB07]QBP06411.1 hypothetical protein [Stenotrophomonas phage YB07]